MPYNQKSDVWSLGCLLYEITTLRHAFDGNNLPSLVLKILRGVYPPIPEHYSSDLKGLISMMLQQNPEDRPSIETILSLPFIQKRARALLTNFKQQNAQPEEHRIISHQEKSDMPPKKQQAVQSKRPTNIASRKVARDLQKIQPSNQKQPLKQKSNIAPKKEIVAPASLHSSPLTQAQYSPVEQSKQPRPMSKQSSNTDGKDEETSNSERPPLFPNISSRSLHAHFDDNAMPKPGRSPTHAPMNQEIHVFPILPGIEKKSPANSDPIHSNPLLAREAEGFRMRREQRLLLHQRRLKEANIMVNNPTSVEDPLAASKVVTVRLEDIPIIPEMDPKQFDQRNRASSDSNMRRKGSLEAPTPVEKPVVGRKAQSAGSKATQEVAKVPTTKSSVVARLTPQELREERLRKEEAKKKAEEAKFEMRKREKEFKKQVNTIAPKVHKSYKPFHGSPRDDENPRNQKEFYVEILCDKISEKRMRDRENQNISIEAESVASESPAIEPNVNFPDTEEASSDANPSRERRHDKDMEDVVTHLEAIVSNKQQIPSPLVTKPTLHPASSESDSLGVRIEHLREICEKQLGDNFIKCYQYIRRITEASNSQDVLDIPDFLTEKQVSAIRYVNQLIYCEDMFYGQPQPKS